MAIRSGRFKSARTIISGRTGRYFRILNTGEFNNTDQTRNQISVAGGPGNAAINLMPTFSIDVLAMSDVSVAASGTGGTVEGVYDALPNDEFKSGRFKTRDPLNPTVGLPIVISGNLQATYRLFNTGPNAVQIFSTNHNGTGVQNIGTPLAEGESYDFVVPNNKIISVKGLGAATDHIEGIYEFVD